ncbi:TPA: hypothetical protein ACFRHF_000025 [Neisseria lactamica]|uniref:hypothetical protein n=1 Tax=Neisseria lactamica TaxID=486 RepID=UPI0002E7BE8E|nr:hypothetical protein [Neisseria lactamica]
MPSETLSCFRRHFADWQHRQHRPVHHTLKCPSIFRIIKIMVSLFDKYSSRTARFTRLKKCRLKRIQTASA